MTKRLLLKYKEYFIAAISLAFLIFFLMIFNIPCPIKHLTGMSCAGCGMTRALISAVRLDFSAAFKYHPLWVLLLPIAAALIILRAKRKNLAFSILLCCTAVLFFGTWIFRLIYGDSVVSFDFENSAINSLIEKIRGE